MTMLLQSVLIKCDKNMADELSRRPEILLDERIKVKIENTESWAGEHCERDVKNVGLWMFLSQSKNGENGIKFVLREM